MTGSASVVWVSAGAGSCAPLGASLPPVWTSRSRARGDGSRFRRRAQSALSCSSERSHGRRSTRRRVGGTLVAQIKTHERLGAGVSQEPLTGSLASPASLTPDGVGGGSDCTSTSSCPPTSARSRKSGALPSGKGSETTAVHICSPGSVSKEHFAPHVLCNPGNNMGGRGPVANHPRTQFSSLIQFLLSVLVAQEVPREASLKLQKHTAELLVG